MPSSNYRSIPNSHWVIPGRFLAGEYLGSLLELEARGKFCRIMEKTRRWRQPTPKSYFPSPETNSQIMLGMAWSLT
jgi:hypothetical protein